MDSVDKFNQVPQNKEINQGSSCSSCCYCNSNCICWLISMALWGLIILTIILDYKLKIEDAKAFIYIIIFVYIVYLIAELCPFYFSNSKSLFLSDKKDTEGIEDLLRKYFNTPPEISFHCQCYHYETVKRRIYTKKGFKGHYKTYTTQEKKVTYSDHYNLEYKSSRDVSGLFNLNCNRAYLSCKSYLKLFLIKEINFADSISVNDYTTKKDDFWRKNRFRDTYMDFSERIFIPGFIGENLIKLTDKEPCLINKYWLVFFTFLTLAEFYKIFYNCSYITQSYTIRKLISTRYDLNTEENNEKYRNLIPRINLIKSHINFDNNEYNYVNKDIVVRMPTKEEIEEAEKKYKGSVPEYEIYKEGENDKKRIIRTGTVKDNPKFSSFNFNEPPPAFVSVAGNVGISLQQINREGTLPDGFDNPDFKFIIESNRESAPENENKDLPSDSPDNINLKIINYEINN